MSPPSGEPGYLKLTGVWPLRTFRVRRVAAIVVAICPPIIFAWLARNSGRWDLFERSCAITTAIGLALASRRYIEYGVHELAMLQAQDPQPDVAEIVEDVFTAKLGFALSAFGTIIWGWGQYLGWWSFSGLLVWALFAARDARRDFKAGLIGLQ